MKHSLESVLKGKIVIVGVGNVLRGDDAFGPALIERLSGQVNVPCIDAGSSPENYTGKIIREKPDTILIVDALHHGGEPGAYMILAGEEIVKSGFTTHDLSPKLFIEYLESETRAQIYLLGVEPETLSLGEEMSGAVRQTLFDLENKLKELLHA
ncbi:MAG: hypothetical protein A3G33_01080 [Omnitrophica bacterium RIFCSPLOWO2_12_FULL_44_17]|uniref:Hydrogenase maturation peptidase HycI n=1 Tax=Candidatus Danuiimicrobium aquiferis TaxID=1801832 RepID=A0A1G1L2W7_9BACT|nr:MAG: hypothetical protein A3B72_06635 [Omnitrophica bacterium RIFCSPHIGHO2_02_FULL_45_28]OGW89906.1 MAG: hypothetical protein A3E74_03665 [Omnitrophica bacterium RIFCSPHIGHO2_12_FULL_44_12]OGW99495.1 MAG: hypothetical protein A3G33_01080 [Omnitrophica bacterium RIFCSPLOWO2_12_FULL_44_17]OGX04331.1 MAG: hypothetical protein A3J12_00795 [Omnitrophica bacterium RIFCSPLOWO2_02_FULL_44_11]